jgi:hypothetical protein
MVSRSGVRFHVRVLSLGVWVLLLGGVLLYATSRALAVVASASTPTGESTAAVAPAEPWLLGIARDGLVGVARAGAVSVGVGVAVVLAGAWLLRSTTRRTP